MEDLIKVLEERTGEIVTMLVFSSLGFIIYMLTPDQNPLRRKVRMAFLGFFISMSMSFPLWLAIGNNKWWALVLISTVLTTSGQFLPELIQSTFKKYATNKANKLTGEDDK